MAGVAATKTTTHLSAAIRAVIQVPVKLSRICIESVSQHPVKACGVFVALALAALIAFYFKPKGGGYNVIEALLVASALSLTAKMRNTAKKG